MPAFRFGDQPRPSDRIPSAAERSGRRRERDRTHGQGLEDDRQDRKPDRHLQRHRAAQIDVDVRRSIADAPDVQLIPAGSESVEAVHAVRVGAGRATRVPERRRAIGGQDAAACHNDGDDRIVDGEVRLGGDDRALQPPRRNGHIGLREALGGCAGEESLENRCNDCRRTSPPCHGSPSPHLGPPRQSCMLND